MLDAGKEFGRYLDVDGDGIPFRTYPGTHASKGAYFTRGTSRNPYATYSEKGEDYQYNMERLLKKFEHAKTLVPKPVLTASKEPARFGVIYYGSTAPSMHEALGALSANNIFINALRVRAFPFQDEIKDFVESHSKVFVVEQNRDAQLLTLLRIETGVSAERLRSVRTYGGLPMSASHVVDGVLVALEVQKAS
jgi:2-oxoglutarate ferredoxin oxidoreductase subunit alpha